MRPFVLWLLVALSSGCAKAATRDDELAYLRTVLPEALLGFANLDIGSEKNVAIHGEGSNQHLGLHVFPGQKKLHGGTRAELGVDYPFKPDDTVRYSWRFMLPEDFVADSPKNRWWLIGQWHDQPDKTKGETWDKHPSVSPPILLGLGELDGKLGLTLGYGVTAEHAKQQALGPIPLERGKWHRISVVIHWSRGADGTASVFMDDEAKPSMTAKGPNMNNEFQHYLKLGMYRHPEIATDNWIYIDDIDIAKAAKP